MPPSDRKWRVALRTPGLTAVMLVSLALILQRGATPATQAKTPTPDRNTERSKQQEKVLKEYEQAFDSWKTYIQRPEIQASSRTSDYIDNPPYRQIVALGKPALPFIMADIAKGEFFLNDAAKQITGIDVVKLYPHEQVLGEQDVSRLWLRWWKKNGAALDGSPSSGVRRP